MNTFDCWLEIDGITGAADGREHSDVIDVVSFGWAESHPAPIQSGLGAGVSRVHVDDLEVVSRPGKASPKLMLACASGVHIATARLTCRTSAEVNAAVLVVSLSKVVVSRYRLVGTAGGKDSSLTDEIALNFREIRLDYRPGPPENAVSGAWNVQENREPS